MSLNVKSAVRLIAWTVLMSTSGQTVCAAENKAPAQTGADQDQRVMTDFGLNANHRERKVLWTGEPLEIQLDINRETRVILPRPVQVGLPPDKSPLLTTQVLDNAVYWTAHSAFKPFRAVLKESDSNRVYLVDITASKNVSAPQVIRVSAIDDDADKAPSKPTVPVARTPLLHGSHYGYVALTRFAAQQMYAPERLLKPLPGVVRVPLDTKPVRLFPGKRVDATPVVGWRSGKLFVTAVRITNRLRTPVVLDPRTVRGHFRTATFQHSRLFPKGDGADTTVAYLISDRPFGEALR